MQKSWLRTALLLGICTLSLVALLAGCGGAAGGYTSMASTYLVLLWIMGVTLFAAGCGNDVSGNAQVPGAAVTVAGPSSTVTATATVTPTPVPAKLAFNTQPGQVDHSTLVASTASPTPNGAFAATVLPAFTVLIEDSNGNIVTTATNAVTIALGNNPNQAQLLGTLTVNAVGGIATFTNVEITNAGVGFTLVASSPGLTGATSDSLTVQPLPSGFQGTTTIACGNEPSGVVLADFNGDGHTDIAFNNLGAPVVTVLLGNGDGTFGAPQNFATGGDGIGVAAGDLNHDGHMDLVTGSGFVSVLLGNGDGTFQAPQNLIVLGGSESVAVADVNNDGKLDVVSKYSSSVSVLLGNGDGTFQTAQNFGLLNGEADALVVADVNGDGKLDVLTSSGYGSVELLLGNGDGTFQAAHNVFVEPNPIFGLAAADFNGDGKLDLADTALFYSEFGGIQVLLGNGDGTFQAPQNSGVLGFLPITVEAANLNLDGNMDLVDVSIEFSDATLLLGNGDGTFQVGPSVGSGVEHIGVAVGDLNADFRPDIVTTSLAPSGIAITLHQ